MRNACLLSRILFGSSKCNASTEIAVGTSTEVRYMEDVRYWEGPLSEVPLYVSCKCTSMSYNYMCVHIDSVGKYLNNYGEPGSGVGLDHVPPGWTRWFALQGNRFVICAVAF